MAVDGSGRVHVLALTGSGRLVDRHTTARPGRWSLPVRMGHAGSWSPQAAPSVTTDLSGRLWLAAVTRQGSILVRHTDAHDGWSAFHALGGDTWSLTSTPALGRTDELGVVADALDRTAERMAGVIDSILGSAMELSASSEHLTVVARRLGDTAVDSHLGLPRVSLPREEVEQQHLPPFQAAIDAGVAAIMTSHVVVEAFGDAPATVDSRVLGMLREGGFTGCIVTDASLSAGLPGLYAAGAVRAGYGGMLEHALAEGEAAAKAAAALARG